jgi:predicted GNAT superfamily acetyltransferase
MIDDISEVHYAQILRINEHFVHWLSPLDQKELTHILGISTYARQIKDGLGVLIGYGHDAPYPNHYNMQWLSQLFDRVFYIDRIIMDERAIGQGYGRMLYMDIENFARSQGYPRLVCEVNTVPDNPGSHAFHNSMGFRSCGEQIFEPGIKAVRYYEKPI